MVSILHFCSFSLTCGLKLVFRTLQLSAGAACDLQTTITINLHLFLFARVQDLQNILCDGVLVLLTTACLKQDFYIPEFTEVKVSLFFKSAILQLQLINLLHEEGVIASGCTYYRSFSSLDLWACIANCGCCVSCGSALVSTLSWSTSTLRPGHFVATCNVEEILTLAACWAIVRLTIIVFVKESLHPLAEFQIVLRFSFSQLGHVNVAFDSVLVE